MSDKPDLHIVPNASGRTASLELLVRKVETIGSLSDGEREAVLRLPATTKQLRAHEDIVRDGDQPSVVTVILDGIVARYKYAPEGNRQIFSFHVPGDMPDAMSLFMERMDHHLSTMTETMIATIPHAAMFELFRQHQNLAYLFWRGTLIEASIFREWMLGLGQREAYPRTARLLCEILTQMQVAGKAEGYGCPLPLTQADLADATGVSNVHINRTLQALRAEGLIE